MKTPSAVTPVQKKHFNLNRRRENMVGWLFITPALVAFLAFIVLPFIASLLLSFTDWNFLSGLKGLKFVGLSNFERMAGDANFRKALTNTLVYVVTTVPISIFLALVLAYLLNGKVFARKTLRLAFFIPYISSIVAVTAAFRMLFQTNGIFNNIITSFGGDPVKWLGGTWVVKVPVILILIYTSIGYEMIVYMAAIQNVPKELYEASTIDGATGLVQFFKITFPLISPTTFYLMVVRMIAAFKTFSAINIITMGTSNPSANSLVTEVYTQAFSAYRFGYASAESLILFIILLLVTLFQFWGQKKWVHY